MESIRLRILLVMFGALLSVGGFGYFTAKAHFQYISLNKELLSSHELVYFTKMISHHPSFEQSTFENMKKYRSQLSLKKRAKTFSDLIQSYADKNHPLVQKRVKIVIQNEAQYVNKIQVKTNRLEKKIQLYGLASLSAVALFMVILFAYIQASIFAPLRNLFCKMIEFLNNRYTYQFTNPRPDEVGKLHATFNALAQRVISNIEELRSLDRAKSDFLSIASHELRTPLTSIKGSLSLLKSGVVGEVNPQVTHLMTIAETETDRLIRLVNEILDLAKIGAKKFPLNRNWHSLNDIVDQTFEAIAGLAQTAGVRLSYDKFQNVDIYVDNNRMQQVFTNLLSNAIKYSPKDVPVTVSSYIKQERLVIEVRDQGRGIAPKDQELIFEQFRQTTGPDNPLVKGTGLGLSIAKAIVEEHGGYIGVHSALGHGCAFYFILPQWKFAEFTQEALTDEKVPADEKTLADQKIPTNQKISPLIGQEEAPTGQKEVREIL